MEIDFLPIFYSIIQDICNLIHFWKRAFFYNNFSVFGVSYPLPRPKSPTTARPKRETTPRKPGETIPPSQPQNFCYVTEVYKMIKFLEDGGENRKNQFPIENFVWKFLKFSQTFQILIGLAHKRAKICSWESYDLLEVLKFIKKQSSSP